VKRRRGSWNIKQITYFGSLLMRHIYTLGAAAVFAALTACGNTADGVKKDAENAADKTAEAAASATDKTAEAAASAGNAVSGAAETGQVKAALLADTNLDAGDINVDTDEGKKTVTLKGTVPAESHKKLAGDIAAAKAVGYQIINDLTIKPK
jgi:osmotically-inducible protein OsmY